jgi:hypothetical protein
LELDEALGFQQRKWAFERIGWAAIALGLGAALLGLFGNGPAAHASVGDANGPLRIEYQRFARMEAPSTVAVEIGPGAGGDGQVHLWLDQAYLDGVEVRRITPEPASVLAAEGRYVYAFDLEDPTRPVRVTFAIRPERFGVPSLRAGLVDGPAAEGRQLVYP